jgi:flagellar motility protein MotE (MotC chaperone)
VRTLITHLRINDYWLIVDGIFAKQTIIPLSIKHINMSRIKQIQKIDDVINVITSIQQSQCSLSELDIIVLNEAIESLQTLKRKKGKTNGQIHKEFEVLFESLIKFFVKN